MSRPSASVVEQRVARGRRPRLLARIRVARAARVVALILAAGAAIAGGIGWVLTSPRFVVAGIEVRGASRVPSAQIVASARIPAGTRLWGIDPKDVATRVEALPEIRRAEIVRELPNRVTIIVEERRPFTLVHAGGLHWVDEEGRLLGEEHEAVAPQVPIISGLTNEELMTMRTAPRPKARAAIALIRALLRSGSGLASEISEIDMSRKEGPVLFTLDGIEVHLGTEGWEERLARLEGVLAHAAQDVRVIDLRFRDQVILQRGGGQP